MCRNVSVHQIENQRWQREGKAVNNFAATLPPEQSELAQQILKDPYVFYFLNLAHSHSERALEQSLTEHITQFLLELGAGFAYIGKQFPIQVGQRDFYLDLLFYHTRLHCYVIVELKIGDFEPEHLGKLNFYINAIDQQQRQHHDAPTIGILLCKNKDKVVAEYALNGLQNPISVSEYQLTESLPENFRGELPSVEAIEEGLASELSTE
jgi:predicted nuclease of restriction endonuclease-like (RecB) superfamily